MSPGVPLYPAVCWCAAHSLRSELTPGGKVSFYAELTIPGQGEGIEKRKLVAAPKNLKWTIP